MKPLSSQARYRTARAISSGVPRRRRGVRYLACDDSSFVTGQVLAVDGGLATSFS